jgi:hypothetical protein
MGDHALHVLRDQIAEAGTSAVWWSGGVSGWRQPGRIEREAKQKPSELELLDTHTK